jgi:hypothetical protein
MRTMILTLARRAIYAGGIVSTETASEANPPQLLARARQSRPARDAGRRAEKASAGWIHRYLYAHVLNRGPGRHPEPCRPRDRAMTRIIQVGVTLEPAA